jgi:hypothetical protein
MVKNYSPNRPSPSSKTSKVVGSFKGFVISISNAIALRKFVTKSIVLSAGGISMSKRTVHQIYYFVTLSVNVIEPVYCPDKTGVIAKVYTPFFFFAGIINSDSP